MPKKFIVFKYLETRGWQYQEPMPKAPQKSLLINERQEITSNTAQISCSSGMPKNGSRRKMNKEILNTYHGQDLILKIKEGSSLQLCRILQKGRMCWMLFLVKEGRKCREIFLQMLILVPQSTI